MKHAYLLQHLHVLPEGVEDFKILGIYSSADAVQRAVQRLKSQPGFKDHPRIVDPSIDGQLEGFYIDPYVVDQDCWSDGYFTV